MVPAGLGKALGGPTVCNRGILAWPAQLMAHWSFSCPPAVTVERGHSPVDHVPPWGGGCPLACRPRSHRLDLEVHTCLLPLWQSQDEICVQMSPAPRRHTRQLVVAQPWDRGIWENDRCLDRAFCARAQCARVFIHALGCPEAAALAGEEHRAGPHTYQPTTLGRNLPSPPRPRWGV